MSPSVHAGHHTHHGAGEADFDRRWQRKWNRRARSAFGDDSAEPPPTRRLPASGSPRQSAPCLLRRPAASTGRPRQDFNPPKSTLRVIIGVRHRDSSKPVASGESITSASVIKQRCRSTAYGAAGEGVVVESTSAAFKPGLKARPSRVQQLELDRPAGLLPRDRGSGSHSAAADEFTDPDFHNVAASRLAVDGQVEKRPVAKTMFSVEPEPDRPNLPRLERTLCANHASGVPGPPRRRCRRHGPKQNATAVEPDIPPLKARSRQRHPRYDVRVGSGATRTKVLPKFSPRSISANAAGITSNPSRISSR